MPCKIWYLTLRSVFDHGHCGVNLVAVKGRGRADTIVTGLQDRQLRQQEAGWNLDGWKLLQDFAKMWPMLITPCVIGFWILKPSKSTVLTSLTAVTWYRYVIYTNKTNVENQTAGITKTELVMKSDKKDLMEHLQKGVFLPRQAA